MCGGRAQTLRNPGVRLGGRRIGTLRAAEYPDHGRPPFVGQLDESSRPIDLRRVRRCRLRQAAVAADHADFETRVRDHLGDASTFRGGEIGRERLPGKHPDFEAVTADITGNPRMLVNGPLGRGVGRDSQPHVRQSGNRHCGNPSEPVGRGGVVGFGALERGGRRRASISKRRACRAPTLTYQRKCRPPPQQPGNFHAANLGGFSVPQRGGERCRGHRRRPAARRRAWRRLRNPHRRRRLERRHGRASPRGSRG